MSQASLDELVIFLQMYMSKTCNNDTAVAGMWVSNENGKQQVIS